MITEDASVYFSSDTASHSATITGITGAVYGYYNREYVEVDMGR